MPALPLSGLRLVVTLPPAEHFWGVNLVIAQDHVPTLRALGATVCEFDTTPFYKSDAGGLKSQIDAVRAFKADAVLGVPNAGYAAEISVEGDDAAKNVFLDVLELPTIFYWDHALLHAARYVIPNWPPKPFYSTGGVKRALRTLMLHPLAHHFVNDTGHAMEFGRLGIATFDIDKSHHRCGGVPQAFIDYGQSLDDDRPQKHAVSFFGNLYVNATQRICYEDEALTAIRERALAAIMSDWDYPAYHAYLREIAALDAELRVNLRLDADQTFYWRYLYDELSVVANGEPRFRKLLACGHPLTYFGGFADVESRASALKAGWTLADEYLPYGHSLAAAFSQSRVSIDVTNAPFIHGFTSKFLACFAAGGFMLTTRKADMAAILGSLVDAIGYSSAAELAAKVDLYLTNDKQRAEVAQEVRDVVRHELSTAAMFTRTVPLALESVRARVAAGSSGRQTRSNVAAPPQELGRRLFDFRLDSLKLAEGSTGKLVGGGLELVSSPQQWAFSLYSHELCENGFTGQAIVRIQVEVRSGRLGLAVAAHGNLSELVVEFPAPVSAQPRVIDIPIEDLADTGAVVIRNQSSRPSKATIRSVQIFRPVGPP